MSKMQTQREKLATSMRQYWASLNTEEKQKRVEQSHLTPFRRGHSPWSKGKKTGLTPWNKGLSQTMSVKGKLRQALKRYFIEHPEAQQKASQTLQGYYADLDNEGKRLFVEQRGNRIRQAWANEDLRKQFRESLRKAHAFNPEWGQKSSETLKQLHADPEWHQKAIKKMHAGRDASWADPQRRETRIRAILQASHRRPTYIEQKIIDILEEYSLPYKYTGDGDVIIGRACPDFTNINGHKKLIEVFGNYWHQPEDVAKKKLHYDKYGFQVLILWENQLNRMSDVEIAKQIRHFTNAVLQDG